MVVGNPANTNCLICDEERAGLKSVAVSGMMRLDHNRATSQLAHKIGKPVAHDPQGSTVWATTRRPSNPDVCSMPKRTGEGLADDQRLACSRTPSIPDRAEARRTHHRAARGLPSPRAQPTRHPTTCRDWTHGSRHGDWVTMAIPPTAARHPEGVI